MIYIIGPGHGGPSLVAHAYLEGHLQRGLPEHQPGRRGDEAAVQAVQLPRRHSQPRRPGDARLASTRAANWATPCRHAYGAAFDNPDLIVACVVGDGEAETGPLATGWHGNKFLNPARDGCVLPILHLNGYKIANPCFLARIPKDELQKFFEGMGYKPYFVEGHDPQAVHQQLADVLDTVRGGDQADLGRRPQQRRRRQAPGLADDRLPHSQGLDLPAGDRRQEVRGLLAHRTRCRWATWTSPSTSRSSNSG